MVEREESLPQSDPSEVLGPAAKPPAQLKTNFAIFGCVFRRGIQSDLARFGGSYVHVAFFNVIELLIASPTAILETVLYVVLKQVFSISC